MNELLKIGSDKLVKLVLVIVGITVLYFSIKKIAQTVRRRDAGKQIVDRANLDASKNYDSYALAVSTAFDAWGFNDAEEMDNVGATLLTLNNDELKEVNNRYLKLYGKGTRTLYGALNNYYICFPCSNLNAIIARVKALGIL